MTVDCMEIRDCFGEKFPMFTLERTRDALATYAALRWPSGRRKAVGKEWDLNDDEARSVCSGKCSWATFDKILSHQNGGWAVIFPIFGALLNQSAAQFIEKEKRRHAEHAQRLGALVLDLHPRRLAARDADPDVDSPSDHGGGARRQRLG